MIRPVGDRAALLELPDNPSVHAAARRARERCADELVDVVPGHRTLLIAWHPGAAAPDLPAIAGLAGRDVAAGETPAPRWLVVPTRYDGADLDAVGRTLGQSPEEVVRRHGAETYRVAFTGFAPGFPYLIAPVPSALLDLPRRATPRTAVPAGSVAVAAGYCGIYPRRSPGGWHLLGRTELVLFDVTRDPPALLEPGTRVRFEAV